jgi:hypothetical protein
MQDTSGPPDPGFVVEWQLADDGGRLVDLSAAEAEVVIPDDPSVRGAPTGR